MHRSRPAPTSHLDVTFDIDARALRIDQYLAESPAQRLAAQARAGTTPLAVAAAVLDSAGDGLTHALSGVPSHHVRIRRGQATSNALATTLVGILRLAGGNLGARLVEGMRLPLIAEVRDNPTRLPQALTSAADRPVEGLTISWTLMSNRIFDLLVSPVVDLRRVHELLTPDRLVDDLSWSVHEGPLQ
jgi:hypothetical protein